jgi:hypothetical protein
MYGEAARTNQMINDVICLVPMHVHFFKNYTVQRRRSQHARTLTSKNTRTQTLPL